MVEYGPFIEYCCELYVHHTVLNAVVGGVIALAAVMILGIGCFAYRLGKRKCVIVENTAMALPFLD